jgi:stage II sporulation protein P
MAGRLPVILWRPGKRWVKVPWPGPARSARPLPKPSAGRTAERPVSPPPRRGETAWSSLASYGLVAALALGVLVASGRAPGPRVLPVTGPLASRQQAGWVQWFAHFQVGTRTGRDWLEAGLPLVAWANGQLQSPWPVEWRTLAAGTVAELTGTPLNNLDRLLASAVPAAGTVTPSAGPPRLPAELRRTAPGLPGDHGRVWAQLGPAPLVGIYQTHSEEAFLPALPVGAKGKYSKDWAATIVQVGWWLAQDLHARGVPAVQSREDNMRQGLLASYNLALGTARTMLRWWPSVRILLDVHRGDAPGATTTVDWHGLRTAKILLVVGTSQLLPNPHWQQNLAFALKLARELNRLAPGILRGNGVETVPYRYNQQLLAGDLQVEIGGPDNTMAEERRAVVHLADALATLIQERQIPGQSPSKP